MDVSEITLYQLRVLSAIVEHGSFTKAGDSLHLSQPAVSAQIRRLRRFAGVPILVRDGRRVVLTEAGRALHRYATEMMRQTDALRRDLKDIVAGERDHVVVAGSLAYATYILPALLSRFRMVHPTVRLSLVEASSPDVVDRVRTGWADLGVIMPGRVRKDFLAEVAMGRLCYDELVVIESADRPFSHGESVSPEELTRIPFARISRVGTATEAPLNRVLAAAGLAPSKTVMEFSTSEGTKDAVRAGAGLAVLFRSVVQRDLVRGELCVLTVRGYEPSRVPVELICSSQRRGQRMSMIFQELVDFLRDGVPKAVHPEPDMPGAGKVREAPEP